MSQDWFDTPSRNGGEIDPAVVLEAGNVGAVLDVVRTGAMVSLSLTRDGGAVRVAVTNDGRTKAEYFRDPMELGTWLGHAFEALSQSPGERGGTAPPAGRQKRS